MTAEAGRAQLEVSYEDDPRVVAEAAVDDYADHVVPPTGRMSKGSLMMAWYGVASAIFYVVTGAAAAAMYGTKSALIGIALTIVVYSLINKVISGEAAKNGLSVAMFSRSMFGLVGAAIATLIFAATAIYYFVFEGSIIAAAAAQHFGGDFKIWAALTCLVGLGLITKGVSAWLDKFNGVLLPFYIIGMVVAVIWAGSEYGFTSAWWDLQGTDQAHALPGWLGAFITYMGVWVLMMFTMDFARLGKTEDQGFHGTVTFGPVFYLLSFGFSALVGIFLANTVPLSDAGFGEAGAASALVELMGLAGFLLIFITQARINTANLYLASSNLDAFVTRVFRVRMSRTVWSVVAAVICFVLMIWGAILTNILIALSVQGVFITAWVAMALVHIAHVRRTGTTVEFRPWRIPAVNVGGMASWILSVAVGLIILFAGASMNPTVVALAPIITAVIAAGLYAISLAVLKPATRNQGADPATEVDDPWAARIKCSNCDKSYIAVEMDRRAGGQGEVCCAKCAQVVRSA